MSSEFHPVWGLYDEIRTARLNCKYYGKQLSRLQRQAFWFDIILGISAPASAVAALWFWQTPAGMIAWKCFGIIAAVAALVRPLLLLPKRTAELEAVLAGHRMLEFEFDEIRAAVLQEQAYTTVHKAFFQKAYRSIAVLVGKNPEAQEDTILKKACGAEVLKELPLSSFYIPEV